MARPPRLLVIVLLMFGFSTSAWADCPVGERLFPGTLTLDDPCVDDELTLPIIASFQNGDIPSAKELDISGEYSKTITKNFGVSFAEDWIHLNFPGGGSPAGFDNLGTSFKYQFVRDAEGETAMSAALNVRWGGTGSRAVGAEPFTTLTPTWFAGKGFGFLPESMKFLRPLGVTVQVGYSFPTGSSTATFDENSGLLTTTPNPQFLVWAGSLQYSMPYLKSRVADLGFPDFFNHLIPLVEWNLETQTINFDGKERTTGTINPGLIYNTEKYQLSLEAILPVNRASGDGFGAIAALHLHLDEIFPRSLGKPIFGAAAEISETTD
jgi:hypothetical protein